MLRSVEVMTEVGGVLLILLSVYRWRVVRVHSRKKSSSLVKKMHGSAAGVWCAQKRKEEIDGHTEKRPRAQCRSVVQLKVQLAQHLRSLRIIPAY